MNTPPICTRERRGRCKLMLLFTSSASLLRVVPASRLRALHLASRLITRKAYACIPYGHRDTETGRGPQYPHLQLSVKKPLPTPPPTFRKKPSPRINLNPTSKHARILHQNRPHGVFRCPLGICSTSGVKLNTEPFRRIYEGYEQFYSFSKTSFRNYNT